jgi:N-acetylmuramoyl-L-alanine amidase
MVEADYVYAFASYMLGRFSAWGDGVSAFLLRDRDEDPPFKERGRRSAGADLVVSLHVNSNESPEPRGLDMFYWPGNMVGESISWAVLKAAPVPFHVRGRKPRAATDLPTPDDDWLQAPRSVLGRHKATAVLVELGFSSNPLDRRALLDPVTRHGLALAVEAGIVRARQIAGR